MEREARAAGSGTDVEVVDLLQLALHLRVHIVLVRRVRGPVPTGGEHLADQEMVGVEVVAQGVVVDLTRGAPGASQPDQDLAGRAVGDLEMTGGSCGRDGEAAAPGRRDRRCGLARKVEVVGDRGEHVRATSKLVGGPLSLDRAAPAERQYEHLV